METSLIEPISTHRRKDMICFATLAVMDFLAMSWAFMASTLLLMVFRHQRIHGDMLSWWRSEGEIQAWLFLVIAAMTLMRMAWQGHYTNRIPFWDRLLAIWKALASSAVIYGIVVIVGKWPISRFLWPTSWCLAACFVPLARSASRAILSYWEIWERPTVLIGSGHVPDDLLNALKSDAALGYRFVAQLDIRPESAKSAPEASLSLAMPTVSLHSSDLMQWLKEHGSPNVIVLIQLLQQTETTDWLEQLSLYRAGVQLIPSMGGLPLDSSGASLIFRYDVLLLHVRSPLDNASSMALKRCFDLACSLIGGLLVLPLVVYVAILIRRQGGEGSIFFEHERIGRGGRPFKCWKFRTMVHDSQVVLDKLLKDDPAALNEWERDFKLKNDPRITHIGAFLRRTSLDELPQLWNVLRGEMSLVGPRPVICEELERYGQRADFYRSVRPGITGLWQVSGRNDLSYPERVALDAWYVKNWRFWYDIAILAKTIRAVVRLDGAY